MTFTYGQDLTDDVDFVRFHTGDVVSSGYFLSDELITSLINVYDTKEAAVIKGLEHIITRLSQPNFRADWLQVDLETGRKSFAALLERKRLEMEEGTISAGGKHVYRKDSYQTEEPTYANDPNPWEDV